MEDRIELVDYISSDRLQDLQNSFSDLVGVGAAISDANGSAITQATGMCDFCKYTRVSRVGSERCRKCDSEGAERAFQEGNPVSYTCHAGLTDFVAPIVIDGQRVGCFVGGQVRLGELDEEKVRQTAKDIGVNPDMYLAMAKRTPVVSQDVLEKAMRFIHNVTLSISDMAYKQYQIEKAKDEVAYAAKLKSDFLANMSHEIRTPMNGVIGMAELAMAEPTLDKAKEYVGQIYKSGKSLLSIIDDILDYSKIESGKMEILPEDYDPRALIEELVNVVAKPAEDKGLKLIVEIDESLPNILVGDSMRVRQVTLNLVSNAIKFTDSGSVTINVWPSNQNESDILLNVSVKDTGIGISEEDQKKLFAEFSQVDSRRNRAADGTGLGLAIARQMVELMQGRIGVKSALGKGSTFIYSIPQTISQNGISVLSEKEDDGPFVAPDARVLIVDDNEVNLTVASGLISSFQIKTDTAKLGQIAIDKAGETRYDMIFMDHMMPELDGVETTKRIREIHPEYVNIPIVALTANVVEGTREMFLNEGLNDYYTKPIERKAITKALRKWLPKEKIVPVNPEDIVAEDVCTSNLHIEGLDTAYALKLLGSETVYMSVLTDYYRTIDKKTTRIKDFYQAADWKSYTIDVHALKSASRQIGAIKLADLAAELERCGNAGELDKIKAHTGELLVMYQEIKAILKPVVGEEKNSEPKPPIEISLLEKLLGEMNTAFDDLDMEEMERVMGELDSYSYDDALQYLMDLLRDAVASVDVDAGAELIDQVKELI